VSRDYLDSGVQVTDLACAEVVARLTGVAVSQMLGHDRHVPVARARHVAIWATRQRTDLSYPELGRLFGNRDHRTAMHSCEQVRTALNGDSALARLALAVERELDSANRLRIAVGGDDVDGGDLAERRDVCVDTSHQVSELFVNNALADAGDVNGGSFGSQLNSARGEVNHDSGHAVSQALGAALSKTEVAIVQHGIGTLEELAKLKDDNV
jgi:hypothetical protein